MKTKRELAKLKKKDLLAIAEQKGIKNISQLKKDKIVELLLRGSSTQQSNIPASASIPQQKKQGIALPKKNKDLTVSRQELHNVEIPTKETTSHTEPSEDSAYVATGELPCGYNQTKIVVIVRDPYWAYTYWDLDNSQQDRLTQIFNDSSGKTRTVLRVHDVTGICFNGYNSNRFWDIDIQIEVKNWYLQLGEPDKEFIVDLGVIDDKGNFYLIARSNRVKTPLDGPSNVVDDKWMIADLDFEELYAASGGYGIGVSSGELKKKRKQLFEQWVTSGMVSSPNMGVAKGKEKDFFLEVQTELILYGRTKPDAKLTVEGKQIALRPDGTFTLRYYLPDGHRKLPVVATSHDGDDTRRITVEVEKDTH